MPMPDEIVGLLRSKITFKWSDGHETIYPARLLRLACRCAMCVEETSGEALLDPATVPETIRAKNIELIGQYAIQIQWTENAVAANAQQTNINALQTPTYVLYVQP